MLEQFMTAKRKRHSSKNQVLRVCVSLPNFSRGSYKWQDSRILEGKVRRRAEGRARGRNLHDTERYDRLCSTCMTLPMAKGNAARAGGKPGWRVEKMRWEKWAQRRGSPPGVPTKGFSVASIPIGSPTTGISLIPLRFGGFHHPRTCLPFCAEFHPRSPLLFLYSLVKFAARVFHLYFCFVYFQGFLILH